MKATVAADIWIVPHGYEIKLHMRHNATEDGQGIETISGCGSFQDETAPLSLRVKLIAEAILRAVDRENSQSLTHQKEQKEGR